MRQVSSFEQNYWQELVFGWWSEIDATEVDCREITSPVVEPFTDYNVVYEIVFEPRALDKARIEVWFTEDNEVAIGLEQRDRVAEQLGVVNRRSGFAAGFEPVAISSESLILILNLITQGEVSLSATMIPWLGLGQTYALLSNDILKNSNIQQINVENWLSVLKGDERSPFRRIVHYRSWCEF